MAFVYWLHTAEQTDFFTEGYVGAASDIVARLRSHKHRFKKIWNEIKVDLLVEASIDYCYQLESKIRPSRNIGWNVAAGGYRNNVMVGKENPNYGKFGEKAPHFIGWYITPLGRFDNPFDAAKAHNCEASAIRYRCQGRKLKTKFLPARSGYAFEQKA